MTPPRRRRLPLTGAEKRALLAKLLEQRARTTQVSPASFAQERLWLLDRLAPDAAAHTLQTVVRLKAALHVSALERALVEIVRRHESLRTTFATAGGRPIQVVGPLPIFHLAVHDGSDTPADGRDAAIAQMAAEHARLPFDLAHGPLLRAALIRLAEADHVLLIAAHRIVADTRSLGILLRETGILYDAFQAGLPSPLLEPPMRPAELAAAERDRFERDPDDPDLVHWRRVLEGMPAGLDLPADRPRPALPTFAGARLSFNVPASTSEPLRLLARREGASLLVPLFAALAALLGHECRARALLIGTPVSGRDRPELEDVVGPLEGLLLLSAELAGYHTFRELFRRARDTFARAGAHRDVPFERLIEERKTGLRTHAPPAVQVTLALEGGPRDSLDGAAGAAACFAPGTARFDLAFSFSGGPGGLCGSLEYATDLFDAATARRFAGKLTDLLQGAAAAPDSRLSDLGFPLDAEPPTPRLGEAALGDRACSSESPALDGGSPPEPRAATTGTERRLERIWADVLRSGPVDRARSFLAQGGDSLAAVRIAARVQHDFDVQLPVRSVFEAPSVAAMAHLVEQLATRGRASGSGALGASRHALSQRRPPYGHALSAEQERLWLAARLAPGSAALHVTAAARLRRAVDPAALEQSLHEVVRRHDALRTTFSEHDGAPSPVVWPPSRLPVALVDLEHVADGAREAEILRVGRDQARSLDLARGPLVAVTLVRLAADDHVLVCSAHRIACDDDSMALLLRELELLHDAALARRTSPLPVLRHRYADFAAAQRARLAGPALDALTAYWKRQLAGAPFRSGLVAREGSLDSEVGARPFALSSSLTARLRELGLREGATLYMTLLTGLFAVLQRWTLQDDIAVGSPYGRKPPELDGLIGCFTDSVVLRTDLAGDPSFRRLLERVREVALEAHEHEGLPLQELGRALGKRRPPPDAPLFDVLFAMPAAPLDRHPPGAPRAPLSLTMTERDGGLQGVFEHATSLFDAATIDRLADHFERLLVAAAGDPDLRLSEFSMLSDAEHEACVALSSRRPPEPAFERLLDRFDEHAARDPDAVAVVAEGQVLRYGELRRRADRLARRLVELGLGPDASVGISVTRGVCFPVALLAILRAGAACVPLDPTCPRGRLSAILDDARAGALLTQRSLAARLPLGARTVLWLDAEVGPAEPPEGGWPAPRSIACVVYTSGADGRPQGAAVTHRALANLVGWQIETGSARARSTLQLADMGLSVSLQEVLETLCAGGTLVVAPEDAARDPARLLRFCADARVERLFVPPSTLRGLAEAATTWQAGLPPLVEVVSIGEPLVITEPIAALFERLPNARLCNRYGAAEAPGALEHRLTGDPRSWPVRPPLGHPVGGVAASVLDEHGRPCPLGVPGEILLGGVAVAEVYVRRAAATARRFVPDPSGWRPGERLFRTQDLGRRLASGDIELVPRASDAVKIRGRRVETAEVEAALAEHGSVREAAVVARREPTGEARLVAFFAAAHALTEGAPPSGELRGFLRARLPEWMLPASFERVDALPRTPLGLVDRRALAARAASAEAPPPPFVAPRNETEASIARVFAELLHAPRVGALDDFFDRGGDALLASRAASRLSRIFRVELPLGAIIAARSVEHLAREIATRASPERDSEGMTRRAADLARALPANDRAALALRGGER